LEAISRAGELKITLNIPLVFSSGSLRRRRRTAQISSLVLFRYRSRDKLEYFEEYFILGEEFLDDLPLFMPLPLISHLNSSLIINVLLFSTPECGECMIRGIYKCI
jgi:hypothetical protein